MRQWYNCQIDMNCDVLSICYWWSVCFMLDALSVCTSQKNNQSLGQSLSQTRDVNKTEMSRRFCSFHVLQVSLVNPGCPYTKRATLFVGARVLAQCAQEDQKHDATMGILHQVPVAMKLMFSYVWTGIGYLVKSLHAYSIKQLHQHEHGRHSEFWT